MSGKNSYYEDDGMLTNTFLQCIIKGPASIRKFFKNIEDKKNGTYKEPDYYLMGNAVDQVLTDADKFDDIYEYQGTSVPTEAIKTIVDSLYLNYNEACRNMSEVPDDVILDYCITANYQNNWKDETKIDKVKKEGSIYYYHLVKAKGKKILTPEQYQQANGLANLLETHPHTTGFFNLDKMKGVICAKSKRIDWTTGAGGTSMHKCKSLLDRIYINTTDEDIVLANGFVFLPKSILVIDYKTVFGYIYQWLEKFYEYRYDFQGAFYYGAAQYQAQVIKSKKKETYKVLNPVFLVGSFTDNYTVWYQMTNDDLKRGRLGDDKVKGYFDAVKLYEQYKESGQWEIPPSLLANFGKLG